ncbi:ADP-ribosylglycohydrolase family protein [Nonomuraea sp. NN258]|uniref:ADP-ribosylglycohydrolase family protein n=1 Tax=Nonomuraea antri TaxID=2730852 RepID=UPI001568496F|nr:ADP-ribosylglycohydrolase family protein [Nonomuraea antri]NRQ30502.1 ADP-ribosylglycohydrolase family protein [Nonomuraea antri]
MDTTRAERALASLTGLSVADAFGDQYFLLSNRGLDPWTGVPPGDWPWSDDTEMACSVTELLIRRDHVDQDALAADFAARLDRRRGYGAGAFALLMKVRDGVPWAKATTEGFGGNGSYGNGAAMRVAPLGAYFAGDPARAAAEAARSAEVTHAHPEGVAGAVAVAVAAAHVAAGDEGDLFEAVLDHLRPGYLRRGVELARSLQTDDPHEAARRLGNGSRITAQDTVPFTLWLAARHRGDYERAVRSCVAVGGDMDTTAAIVGGILGGPPEAWRERRDPLPAWFSFIA